ncbi:phosphoglucomutase/phosphomannomutase family protein [bacterium]|nr:phosphoglucomutase/phosphomannomutase family protein [bacterium]
MAVNPIKFGTDGWRGIISFDFTFPRTVTVAEAVRRYLAETGASDRPLLIGYDNRFQAAEFASNVANYLAGQGQATVVFEAPVPTPVCAFAVRHENAAGALMFTASHNPFYYLGIKFIPDFAGPAETSTTERITDIIFELEKAGFEPPQLNTEWRGETLDVHEDYFAQLDKLVNAAALSTLNDSYLYSSFHGVGAGWLDEYLRRYGVKVDSRFTERDVLFGGLLPDPSPANLESLQPDVAEGDYALLLATDGDADRFGLMTADGEYFGCNRVLPLLAEFLLTTKERTGSLVRTVATSHMLDAVAVAHGMELKETPVGFKYVGRELREGALIGGEESGGLSVEGHVPEKDAILSILLLLDMLATKGARLSDIWQEFGQQYGQTVFARLDVELPSEMIAELMSDVEALAQTSTFLDHPVSEVISIDGVKLVLEDGSWVLLRPSGTEAVVRAYLEAPDERGFNLLRKALVNYLHDYTVQP